MKAKGELQTARLNIEDTFQHAHSTADKDLETVVQVFREIPLKLLVDHSANLVEISMITPNKEYKLTELF